MHDIKTLEAPPATATAVPDRIIICKTCWGAGSLRLGGRPIPCSRCGGSRGMWESSTKGATALEVVAYSIHRGWGG